MIYLIQDCYEDNEGNFHRILKVGYSSKPFEESRKTQYDTHNFGYKVISEREGSQELEKYLHKRFIKYNLSREWFKYDSEIVKIFSEVSEDDISDFVSQEELNRYIKDYILTNLVPSVSKLSNLYLENLLEELREESKKKYPDLEYNEVYLRKEILGVFKFVSSRERKYFENLDFEDQNIKSLLSDCSLIIDEIAGRQRKETNPFKNEITIFYKTQKKVVTRKEFDEIQKQRIEKTQNILEGFRILPEKFKKSYLDKLKDSVEYKRYSDDFVAVSEETNLPVYNYLVEISNERAWEVSQKDYQDNISVTKALEDQGFKVDGYQSSDDIILQDFLDNHFYRTGIFEEKLKMYCEFRDTYGGNQDLMRALGAKILDQKFKMYYEYYGTSGCRAVSYKEIDLYRGWKDITKEENLETIIYSYFKVGQKHPMSEIKNILSEIYKFLGLSKTPKATDLKDYFKLSRTTITLPDKTTTSGYKLDPL